MAACSAFTFFVSGASFRNITTRCAGSLCASRGNGVRLITVRHSCPLRTKKSVSRRSEEHMSELQSPVHLVCRLLLEKKKNNKNTYISNTYTSKHYTNHQCF